MFLFKSIVGSTAKLGIKTSDLDLRGFYVDSNIFNPLKPVRKFEWHRREDNYDLDGVEILFAIKQIIKGCNSCPVFFNCLYSPIYEVTDLGQELMDNRDKLISQNLISGTLKFCDRKARSRGSHSKSKYLYYACSDMLEIWDILLRRQTYPLDLPQEVIDLYLGKSEDEQVYRNIREDFSKIKVQQKPDIKWIEDFSKKAYKCI